MKSVNIWAVWSVSWAMKTAILNSFLTLVWFALMPVPAAEPVPGCGGAVAGEVDQAGGCDGASGCERAIGGEYDGLRKWERDDAGCERALAGDGDGECEGGCDDVSGCGGEVDGDEDDLEWWQGGVSGCEREADGTGFPVGMG